MKTLQKLKMGLILFWALWFSCATLTNFMDMLFHFNLLPDNIAFVSHNYNLMKGVMSIYHLSDSSVMFTFILIVIYELFVSCNFWLAFRAFIKNTPNKIAYVNRAFTLGIALWAAFMVGEEIFIAYAFEGVHLNLLMAQIICLILIRITD